MLELVDKETCTGCSACASICGRGAIRLEMDEEGFRYPVVDQVKCVHCRLCEKICPVGHVGKRDRSPICFAAASENSTLLRQSTSGAIFSELAKIVVEDNGVVFGCAYDGAKLNACHIVVRSVDEIARLRGSKYVQSDMKDCYNKTKEVLKENVSVLFSGTPCQIAGLYAFLGEKPANLLTVEVICHGVPSVRLFEQLKDCLRRSHGKLLGIAFRDKAVGWGSRVIAGIYEDGKVLEKGDVNDYNRAFLAGLSIRRSCGQCCFTDGRSGADLTLGDFWGIGDVGVNFDYKSGVSAVIVHTRKGLDMFNLVRCGKQKVKIDDIVKGNPSYRGVRRPNSKRDTFMRMACEKGFSMAYRAVSDVGVRRYVGALIRKLRRKIF